MQDEKTPYISDDDELLNSKTKAVPKPEKNIGIDTAEYLYQNIINAGTSSQIDISAIESFTRVSQSRNQIYTMLDTMCQDSMISAILETYAEDATEYNDNGKVVWVESSDDKVAKYVTFLLDSLNVDKHIYKWAYNLCKYGDVYLRLYRESDYQDLVFDTPNDKDKDKGKGKSNTDTDDNSRSTLHEDVNLINYSKNDKYVHYVEMVPNPAEVFELTRFGKTSGYIKTTVPVSNALKDNNSPQNFTYKYTFNKSDVDVFAATEFVHAALEDNSSRTPEEVDIFIDNNEEDETKSTVKSSYTVKRGQSLLYNVFKIWRELNLLENSILLNRVTKSSIVRVIGVEVGDMPKENVAPHLMGIKGLVEQKSAIDEGVSMNEYTNPGPIENNIYVPTRNGIGAITTQQIGGDVDVKGLADLDYFKNKFFGALRVPKQYFGDTDDAAGFSGGQSLSIISSRYAKMIKRIQNTLIQMITDAVNLMLIDKGLEQHINKFEIHMLPPTTQEEIDRRDNLSSKVQIASDIIGLTADIEDPIAKLKILKSLISSIVTDNEIMTILMEEIERLEQESYSMDDGMGDDMGGMEGESDDFDTSAPLGIGGGDGGDDSADGSIDMDTASDTSDESEGGDDVLPSPAELGDIDFTNNNTEF